MKKVEIYTDGACSGNPGPGGWGAILRYNGIEKELSGGEAATTNNRMELSAVIAALSALREQCEVDLYSDSKYVIDALSKGWARSWRAKNWIKSDKKPVSSRNHNEVVGSDKCIVCDETESRRTVNEDEVIVVLDRIEKIGQEELAAVVPGCDGIEVRQRQT